MSSQYWDTLYTKDRTGGIRFWRVRTEKDDIVVEHGVQGGATVVQRRLATPKNVGRSNATTGEQQARLEAQALHVFKLERKYSLTPEEAQEVVPLPMLAKDFSKIKNIEYPVDVQPKLDGVRAIARWEGSNVVLISRGGKLWVAVPHINRAIEKVLPRESEFDGEIYVHGKPFQWITSRAKKAHEDSPTLQYHVYDMPTVEGDDSLPWRDREIALHRALMYSTVGDVIVSVGSTTTPNKESVISVHDACVADGYEGAIVRLLNGAYEYGHRSSSLLKLKQFDDAEFTIVGHTTGEGTEAGLVIWMCANDADPSQLFLTRPKGTHEDRHWLFEHGSQFHGKKLKVKFFGRTDDGLPRFPVGEGLRAEEDMS